jgi:HPt (histidine-containing phosphotransfer) domain-containing protein
VLPELPSATEALAEHRSPPLAPNQAAPANPVSMLDREVFRELAREIGEEAAAEVHSVFAIETEARLKLLRELPIESERTRIGREAHSLKSSAGTFGYRALAGLALRLERDAGRLAEAEYLALLDSIDAAYASAAALELQG